MKVSRRGFFGLGAGAAAVPFVTPATPAFAEAVAEALPRAAKVASEFKHVAYGAYVNDFGALTVGAIPDSVMAKARRDIDDGQLVGPADVEFYDEF